MREIHSGTRTAIPSHCSRAVIQGRGHRSYLCCCPKHNFRVNSPQTSGLLKNEWSFSPACNPQGCQHGLLKLHFAPGQPTTLNSYSDSKKRSFLIELVSRVQSSPRASTDGENLQTLQVGCSSVFLSLIHSSLLKSMEIAMSGQSQTPAHQPHTQGDCRPQPKCRHLACAFFVCSWLVQLYFF